MHPGLAEAMRARRFLLRASVSLLLLSLALRVGMLAFSDLKHGVYRVETDRIALSLVKGRGYANPFLCETGPTAFYPPLYPAIMAAVYGFLGEGLAGELAKGFFHLLLTSICVALLPMASKTLSGEAGPGLFAGFLGILSAIDLVIELHGREMGLMAVLVMGAGLLFARRLRQERIGWRQGVPDGVFYGAGLLVGTHLLPVMAVSLGLLAWEKRAHAWRYAVAVPAAAALCLLPWAVRNWMVLGQPVLLRSNFWLEQQVSNNDQSKLDVMSNLVRSEGRLHHPFTNPEECALYAALGEMRYMERKREIFLNWLRDNPLRFARLSLERARLFWFPPRGSQLVFPELQWLITSLGWAGLWVMRRRGVGIWRWFALLWLVYPLVYYTVQFDYRYRYPIQWTLLLCAGWAVTVLARHRPEPGPAAGQK